MATEIERKFLVQKDLWEEERKTLSDFDVDTHLKQGFLSTDKDRVVRVRIENDSSATLTIKGGTQGISRREFEYPIPVSHAHVLLEMCLPPILEKTRCAISMDNHVWEVDEFHGENEGLLLAEIELESEDAEFTKPPWVGAEVSHDKRYFNSNLISNPFKNW